MHFVMFTIYLGVTDNQEEMTVKPNNSKRRIESLNSKLLDSIY